MTTHTIADRIERLRAHDPDLTLEGLDDLAGLGKGHVSQIVRGRTSMPREGTLRSLSRVLGTEPAWLAFGAGEEPDAQEVHAAIGRARRRRQRFEHAPKVSAATGARKGAARSRNARAVGAAR